MGNLLPASTRQRGREKSLLPILPKEMVEEIMVRLPVKSLVRFQSVSQAWNARIQTSSFVRSHKERNKDSKKLIIDTRGRESHIYLSPLIRGEEEPALEVIPHNFEHNGDRFTDGYHIVGSCDGILLLVVHNPDRRLFMWNPSTREYRLLPKCNGIDPLYCVMYGFGCATSDKNNYKVLCKQVLPRSNVQLYSTSTNSWKKVNYITYISVGYHPWILVNAKLYSFERRLKGGRVLLAFDIGSEQFKEVPEPDCNEGESQNLVELNGELCILCSKLLNSQIMYVWVMKEYGTKESWTNMFCINMDAISDLVRARNYGDTCDQVVPLYFFDNGEIILHSLFDRTSNKLISYNCKSHKASIPKLHGVSGCYFTTMYVETLISPNA